MLARMWNNSLLVGMQNSRASKGDNLAASYKAKHTLTVILLGICLMELKASVLDMEVHSNFIYHCPKLGINLDIPLQVNG